MRYIIAVILFFLLFSCDSSTSSNDNNQNSKEEFTAQINSESFIADSVSAILYYYTIPTIPRWRLYINAIDDSNDISIILDHFTSDGEIIPKTTYNLNTLTNSALLSHG